jgi:hypothetical protein
MEDRLVTQAETLLARMKVALEEAVPDPDLFDWPEPAEAEDGDALYDSTRGYVEQVDRYRDHTGAMTMMSAWPMDRVVTKTCKLCGESFSAANPKRIFCTSRCTNKSYKNSLRARA